MHDNLQTLRTTTESDAVAIGLISTPKATQVVRPIYTAPSRAINDIYASVTCNDATGVAAQSDDVDYTSVPEATGISF